MFGDLEWNDLQTRRAGLSASAELLVVYSDRFTFVEIDP